MLKSKSPRLVVRPNPGRSTAMPPVRSSSPVHRSLLVGTPWTYRTSAPGALRQNTGWPSSSSRCSVVAVNAGRPYWRAMRTLCIGEALVDLVCERPVAGLEAAGGFVPHPGGVVANACVIATRLGGEVALAGGAGDDAWGRWLRARLDDAGVNLDWFDLTEGAQTAVAFVTVDHAGEPAYVLYGGGRHVTDGEGLAEAVEAHDALALTSNTLVDEDERAATLAARQRAFELGRPIVVDVNLRLHRWPHPGRAATVVREYVHDAFLVKCNREEAKLLSGEPDPERAAAGLLAAGAAHVIIPLGAGGAMLRGGGLRADAAAAPAEVVDTTGAGDAFFGVLLARLGRSDYYPPALPAALPEAVREAARATERWGAT